MTTELKGNEYFAIGDQMPHNHSSSVETSLFACLFCLFVFCFGGEEVYLLIIQVNYHIWVSGHSLCCYPMRVRAGRFKRLLLSVYLAIWLCLSVHDRKTALQ